MADDDFDWTQSTDSLPQPPTKPFAATLDQWARYNLADSSYQQAMADGDGSAAAGPSTDPTASTGTTDHVHVIVGNNLPIIGDHVGVMIGSGRNAILWDPGGSYGQGQQPPIRGSDGTISGSDASLDGFVNHLKTVDGPDVNVYTFPVTADEAGQIRKSIGGDTGGLCAIDAGNALRGIGPFKDLGTTLTPSMMDSEMRRLQKGKAD